MTVHSVKQMHHNALMTVRNEVKRRNAKHQAIRRRHLGANHHGVNRRIARREVNHQEAHLLLHQVEAVVENGEEIDSQDIRIVLAC
jgi:hypothetical protein